MRWPIASRTLATVSNPRICPLRHFHRLRLEFNHSIQPAANYPFSNIRHFFNAPYESRGRERKPAELKSGSKTNKKNAGTNKKNVARNNKSSGGPTPSAAPQKARSRSHPQASASKAKKPENVTWQNLEFSKQKLIKTLRLPTRENLPGMPRDFIQYPASCLNNTVESLGGTVSTSLEAIMVLWKTCMRMKITVKLPDHDDIVALGDGFNKNEAKSAAALHAIGKLHEIDALKLAWGEQHRITRADIKDEKGGVLDIYNYAARYGCIPVASANRIGRFFNLSIKMPEHEIDASVRVIGGLEKAETAAAREFKRQAEMYHLSKGTDNLVVKDSTSLNTSNAKEFFEFCRDTGQGLGYFKAEITSCPGDIWMGKPGFTASDIADKVEPVKIKNKLFTEKIAALLGAVSVVKERPHLLEDFVTALRAGNGSYLSKVRAEDVYISQESLKEMKALKSFESRYSPTQTERPAQDKEEFVHQRRPRLSLGTSQLAEKSAQLQGKLEAYKTRPDLVHLRQARSELPMTQYASRVREIVESNIYCVIIGATGSGKTTQVPQILFDQAIESGNGASCNIICTQPRRIAATSVAKRVASERAEKLQDTVGYQVRFDAKLPKPGGSILYCTTGILLQQLQRAPDEVFDNVSHVVIDEVHERDIIIDFLLITLKKTMAVRAAQGKKLPRVILMSATIDATVFADYFKDSLPSETSVDCPTLSVPGRTFPVKELFLENVLTELKDAHGGRALQLLTLDKDTRQYLEAEKVDPNEGRVNLDTSNESVIDWKRKATTAGDEDALADNKDDALVPLGLAAATIAHIAKTTENGAILVFLPGLDEMEKLDKMLRAQAPLGVDFNDTDRFQVFMLHSSIQDSQKTVFDPLPDGCRKVILSTNIAETSVTIPDVQFVVDTGKSREKRYQQTRRITQLQCMWISKSNAKQRAGRAGRVQHGAYYALFTRSRRESMRAAGVPELLRTDLQETCLDVKIQAFKMPVREFLAGAVDPPSDTAVDSALQNLIALGALTPEEDLTPLGRLLASLPVHPTLGKMIVLGIIFRCLEPMIILGAAATQRPLFVIPISRKREVDRAKRKFAGRSNSDHIMLLNAFRVAREASAGGPREAYRVFEENFIHSGAYKTIESTAREIEDILQTAGLIQNSSFERSLQYGGPMLNENSDSEPVIKALLTAGLYPNFAAQSGRHMFRTSAEKRTFVHPSSVNSGLDLKTSFLAFTNMALSSDGGRLYLRDTTLLTPLMALLFGGSVTSRGPIVEMDQWLPLFIKVQGHDPKSDIRFGDRMAADYIMVFRRLLDRMMTSAFDDLAMHKPLANDPLRERVAHGLARVLVGEESGRLSVDSLRWSSSEDHRRQGAHSSFSHDTPDQETRGRSIGGAWIQWKRPEQSDRGSSASSLPAYPDGNRGRSSGDAWAQSERPDRYDRGSSAGKSSLRDSWDKSERPERFDTGSSSRNSSLRDPWDESEDPERFDRGSSSRNSSLRNPWGGSERPERSDRGSSSRTSLPPAYGDGRRGQSSGDAWNHSERPERSDRGSISRASSPPAYGNVRRGRSSGDAWNYSERPERSDRGSSSRASSPPAYGNVRRGRSSGDTWNYSERPERSDRGSSSRASSLPAYANDSRGRSYGDAWNHAERSERNDRSSTKTSPSVYSERNRGRPTGDTWSHSKRPDEVERTFNKTSPSVYSEGSRRRSTGDDGNYLKRPEQRDRESSRTFSSVFPEQSRGYPERTGMKSQASKASGPREIIRDTQYHQRASAASF